MSTRQNLRPPYCGIGSSAPRFLLEDPRVVFSRARLSLALAAACLLLGGCLSSSQFAGAYSTDWNYEKITDANVDLEISYCTEVSYDFWGHTVDGYRTVIRLRSKVDFPQTVTAKLESPESSRFLSVWHDVEQRLEPGQTCQVISVLIKPTVTNRNIDFHWSARRAW
jgi:hypothetical protein